MKIIFFIFLTFSFLLSLTQISYSQKTGSDFPITIAIKPGEYPNINTMLTWKNSKNLQFKELCSLGITVFIIKKGIYKNIFLIKDMNKGKVSEEDYTIDLGKYDAGEYQVWIQTFKNIQYSNKINFKIGK